MCHFKSGQAQRPSSPSPLDVRPGFKEKPELEAEAGDMESL